MTAAEVVDLNARLDQEGGSKQRTATVSASSSQERRSVDCSYYDDVWCQKLRTRFGQKSVQLNRDSKTMRIEHARYRLGVSVEQIAVDEVICVRATPLRLRKGQLAREQAEKEEITGKRATTSTTLYLYVLAERADGVLRLRERRLHFANATVRDTWTAEMNRLIEDIPQRPKNLIVFINPFGGHGRGEQDFRKNVEPLFRLLPKLRYEVLLTERAGHSRDHILEMPDDEWKALDGAIAVGGDGAFNDMLDGVLKRTQRDAGIEMVGGGRQQRRWRRPHLRLGMIGAGSTNSIVATVHGTVDEMTAALHVVLGSSCLADVATVRVDEELRHFSMLFAAYGWIGAVLKSSEPLRPVGPIRYQFSGLHTLIRHPTYRGTLSYTLADGAEPPAMPLDDEECAADFVRVKSTKGYEHSIRGDFTHIFACVAPAVSPMSSKGLAPFAGISDGVMDLGFVAKISRWQNIQLLYRVQTYGGMATYYSTPALHLHRVRKFAFRPDRDQSDLGTWNVDGELLRHERPGETIYSEIVPRLIRFFGIDPYIHPVKSQKSLLLRGTN